MGKVKFQLLLDDLAFCHSDLPALTQEGEGVEGRVGRLMLESVLAVFRKHNTALLLLMWSEGRALPYNLQKAWPPFQVVTCQVDGSVSRLQDPWQGQDHTGSYRGPILPSFLAEERRLAPVPVPPSAIL